MKMDWGSLVLALLPTILSQVPKLAPISNEITTGVIEAEAIFQPKPGDKTGPDKLNHVIGIAKQAAQATDELKGSPDEVAGPVSKVVSAAIPLINVLVTQHNQASE